MSDDGSDDGIVSDLVEQGGDLVSSLLHSVPAVVLKNALKAVGRLSTAAVSVPAAWLEGKAADQGYIPSPCKAHSTFCGTNRTADADRS
jgi:hypothetical protein